MSIEIGFSIFISSSRQLTKGYRRRNPLSQDVANMPLDCIAEHLSNSILISEGDSSPIIQRIYPPFLPVLEVVVSAQEKDHSAPTKVLHRKNEVNLPEKPAYPTGISRIN